MHTRPHIHTDTVTTLGANIAWLKNLFAVDKKSGAQIPLAHATTYSLS